MIRVLGSPAAHVRKAVMVLLLVCAVWLVSASTALAAGTISGDVRNDAGPIVGATIKVLDANTLAVVASTQSVAVAGGKTRYSISVPNGTYIVSGQDIAGGDTKPSYFGKVALNVTEAERVTVTTNAVLDRTDVRLFTVGSFTGSVEDTAGAPLGGIRIEAWLNDGPPEGWGMAHHVFTKADGSYEINVDTLHFDYVLVAHDLTSDRRRIVYPDKQDFDEAAVLTPVTNVVTPLDTMEMGWGTSISGALTAANGDLAGEVLPGDPANGLEVHAWYFKNGEWYRSGLYWLENNLDGTYDISGLWPGTYRLSFEDPHLPPIWQSKVYTIPDAFETTITAATDLTLDETTRHATANAAISLYDSLPPVTTLSLDPVGLWVRTAVTATLSAIDDITGVAQTLFSVNGAEEQTYSAPFVMSEEGTYTVAYRSIDVSGNAEATQTATVGIDMTAPSLVASAPTEWRTTAAPISAEASDALSGIATLRYRVDTGVEQNFTSPGSMSVEGVHDVGVWAIDRAGNTSAVDTVTVKVDLTAPVTTSNAVTRYTNSSAVTLVPSDAHSGVQSTWYRFNGAPPVAGTSFATSVLGRHSAQWWSTDVAGNKEATKTAAFDVVSPTVVGDTITGTSDIAQSVAASQFIFRSVGAPAVVVIGTGKWSDVVVATPVAKALNAPILMTSSTSLSPAVRTEIARLGAEKAYIFGGTSSVSTAVENTLKTDLGATDVTRVNGATRYDVAAAAAQMTIERTPGWTGRAVLVTVDSYQDGLVVSAVAGKQGYPIYLAERSAAGGLTPRVIDSMKAAGVTEVIAIGTTTGLPGRMLTDMQAAGITANRRVAGANAIGTSVAVAQWAVGELGMRYDRVAFANTTSMQDQQVAGWVQARSNSVVLLTGTTLDSRVQTLLRANRGYAARVRYFGNTTTLPTAVRNAILTAIRL